MQPGYIYIFINGIWQHNLMGYIMGYNDIANNTGNIMGYTLNGWNSATAVYPCYL